MDACRYTQMISAYHDGELPDGSRSELERHLSSGCDECVAEVGRLRRLSELLAARATPALPAETLRRLYALAPRVAETGVLRLTEWVTGIAAAVLIAGSVWMVMHKNLPAGPSDVTTGQQWATVATTGTFETAESDTDLPSYIAPVVGDSSPETRP